MKREVLPKEDRERRARLRVRAREIREAASLSKGHNSIEPDLPFRLNGSQAKTAYALRLNCETLIREAGIETVGFLTLTVGDTMGDGSFAQIFDAEEASRRINSLRPILASLFLRWIVVTERHKNGAIHFHLVGAMANKDDVRTGFDWENFTAANSARCRGAVDARAEKAYAMAASPAIRDAWRMLRETLPKYGFGRAELTPIRKTGESVASYVSKYVEKNLFNRVPADVGKRLVRYGGWKAAHLKPNEFGWGTPKACEWRRNAEACALAAGLPTRESVAEALGPRWAFTITKVMARAAQIGSPYKCEAIDLMYFRECIVQDMRRAMDGHTRRELAYESICGQTVWDWWFHERDGRVKL